MQGELGVTFFVPGGAGVMMEGFVAIVTAYGVILQSF